MKNLYQFPSESCDDIEQRNFWAKVVDDQIASGMGAKRFCQQHQINHSKFHYWKYNKIKSTFDHSKSIKTKNKQPDKDIAKFISLQIAKDKPFKEHQKESAISDQNKIVEIVFKNRHKIILPLPVSATNLSLLIKTVAGLEC